MASGDTVFEVISEVLQAHRLRHLSEPEDSLAPVIPPIYIASSADQNKRMLSLRTFSCDCCGGIDELRLSHLLDLVADPTAEAGLRLCKSITNLTNKIHRGDVSDYAVKHVTLNKKDGSVCPVAVGNVFRRLAAKVGCHVVSRAVPYNLSPIQLGVSVKGSAESAVHALRRFINTKIDSHDPKVTVKLDMKKAFNSVRRDNVLQTCFDHTPKIAKLAFLSCSKFSSVIESGHSMTSSSGDQQGYPISPLLFTLAVNKIGSGVVYERNVWYLDDEMIGCSPESVLSDVQSCITK